ncbi:MAG: heme NO-binding domain-containing protein [Rhodobacteraceae bacterium]|nr:heme NO-binding domain-containing protein [Paracoccaceae bacterium]
MHGLINRAIELFVRDTYGRRMWLDLSRRLDIGPAEFEAMLDYDDAVTDRVLSDLERLLDKPRCDLLEDIGTYLVSHRNDGALRRLLRFSGVDFVEFLHSLDDLPARARLAVSDLELPQLELREHATQRFSVTVRDPRPGPIRFGHVLIGLLRAMADDYGALVVLEHRGGRDGTEIIAVQLLEVRFAEGRDFVLGVV